MTLTPQDIVRKEFREALRGYNQADVDLFLDEVVEEFARLTEENQRLRVRLAAVQQEVARYREARGGTAPVAVPSPDVQRVEAEIRARLRRFLEEQLRALDASPAPSDARAPAPQVAPELSPPARSATVERITREVPLPPADQRPSGARQPARRDPAPVVRREPEPPPHPVEPAPRGGSREPFWAGE